MLQSEHPPISSANSWLVVLMSALAIVVVYQAFSRSSPLPSPQQEPRAITPRGELADFEKTTINIFRQTSPSVVFIRTKGYQRFLFGGTKEQELSSGTGFVWDRHGHIVTNLHVVEDSLRSNRTAMEVQFSDKSVVDAELIGGVSEHDIAILRVSADAQQLQPILLGTSDDLIVGQQVLAIGNPFGFDHTLSTGVIGGLNRSVSSDRSSRMLDGLIQTDAAINPGNSGGPLLDSSGRMIGVNTAIVSPTGAYSGLGFAVPVSRVVESVELVLEESSGPQRPVLGISVLSPEQVAEWGIPDSINERGLFIRSIDPTGSAADTGLEPSRQRGYHVLLGDQITAIDDKQIRSVEELHDALNQYSPGDTVEVHIFRGERRGSVQITLQARKLLF